MPIPRPVAFLILIASIALAGAYAIAQEQEQPSLRVVEMTANNYEFTPASVHVKVGESVAHFRHGDGQGAWHPHQTRGARLACRHGGGPGDRSR